MENFLHPNPATQHLVELDEFIHEKEDCYTGFYQGKKLHSAFQPIFSLAHKRVIGYEALVRVKNENDEPISPSTLFNSDVDIDSLTHLDRLCRYLHIKNFSFLNDSINWLFLNVSPQIITHGKSFGSFFNDLLEVTGVPPHQIVIEIVEYPIAHQEHLVKTIEYYKDMGCLIAIDDFGAGDSNFERIWSLNPEIVKLDRSMIVNAAEQPKIRRLLPEIVSLLHQAGSLILIEGVETEEQAMIAMECDVDFVQGFYFAKPTISYLDINRHKSKFDKLFDKFKQTNSAYEKQIREVQAQYETDLLKVVDALRQGVNIKSACFSLVTDPTVVRCYLMSPSGIQIGHTIISEYQNNDTDLRFRPIQDAESADWFRRHYLRNAISHPEQLQISNPYLSITGAHMCITFSIMFATETKNCVFCCDLNWF